MFVVYWLWWQTKQNKTKQNNHRIDMLRLELRELLIKKKFDNKKQLEFQDFWVNKEKFVWSKLTDFFLSFRTPSKKAHNPTK